MHVKYYNKRLNNFKNRTLGVGKAFLSIKDKTQKPKEEKQNMCKYMKAKFCKENKQTNKKHVKNK